MISPSGFHVHQMISLASILKCGSQRVETPLLQFIRNFQKQQIKVVWEKPEMGWTKLNFDGSCKGREGKAAIGGLLRSHKAEFIFGYAESIGKADSTTAELTALRRGLELVLENGWNHVWLEGDCKALVEIIVRRREVKCSEFRKQVSHVLSLMHELDYYAVSHVYREGNRAADRLAQMAHSTDKPQIWSEIPPAEVLPILDDDAAGKIVLRRG